ncbi:ribokinase-like [Lytechinus pictus]|uniref:ribokinase-like n=1 Tax=Lytechinus pictus TaxID=7653 RepID=UPI0030B9F040
MNFLSITKEASTGVAPILVEDSGQNSIVIISGANFEITPADVNQAMAQMDYPKVLVCQLEILQGTVLAALKEARSFGITTVFNPAPGIPDLPDEFYQYSDIFCPNETETQLLTGLSVSNVEEAKKASLVLLDKGCKTAVITMGSEGAVYATAESRTPIHVPTDAVTAVDTTGAGDAFIGSLAFYLANHPSLDLGEMIKRSCAIASISVLAPGTQTSFPWKQNLPSSLL